MVKCAIKDSKTLNSGLVGNLFNQVNTLTFYSSLQVSRGSDGHVNPAVDTSTASHEVTRATKSVYGIARAFLGLVLVSGR